MNLEEFHTSSISENEKKNKNKHENIIKKLTGINPNVKIYATKK